MRGIFYFDAADVERLAVDTKGAQLIAVKAGEVGYWPIFSRRTAAELNDGTPTDVLDSALNASMFGWDCPIADKARNYAEAHSHAEPERTNP